MFDLETAIAEWRRQMLATGIKRPAPIEELESHLREEIEQRINSGFSTQRAFELSVQHLGHAEMLQVEFKKSRGGRESYEWWVAHLIIFGAGAAYCFVLAMAANVLFAVDMSLWNRLLGIVAVGASITAILGGRYLKRFFPVLPQRRTRVAVQFACLVPVMIWYPVYANIILPHLDFDHFDRAGLFVAILWTITLLPISFRLWKGFDDATFRQASTAK